MADSQVRDLERRWNESKSLTDEVLLLRARMRLGILTSDAVEIAAHCGHKAAVLLYPGAASLAPTATFFLPQRLRSHISAEIAWRCVIAAGSVLRDVLCARADVSLPDRELFLSVLSDLRTHLCTGAGSHTERLKEAAALHPQRAKTSHAASLARHAAATLDDPARILHFFVGSIELLEPTLHEASMQVLRSALEREVAPWLLHHADPLQAVT